MSALVNLKKLLCKVSWEVYGNHELHMTDGIMSEKKKAVIMYHNIIQKYVCFWESIKDNDYDSYWLLLL